MAKSCATASRPNRSWRNTTPGFGFGGVRSYGGVTIPLGGRKLKAPSVHKWTRPVSLLTKQEANARLQFGHTVPLKSSARVSQHTKSRTVWKQQAQQAQPKFGPKVQGCHLTKCPMVSQNIKSHKVWKQHCQAQEAKTKKALNLITVKQEEMEVTHDHGQSLMIANGGLDRVTIIDSVLKM